MFFIFSLDGVIYNGHITSGSFQGSHFAIIKSLGQQAILSTVSCWYIQLIFSRFAGPKYLTRTLDVSGLSWPQGVVGRCLSADNVQRYNSNFSGPVCKGRSSLDAVFHTDPRTALKKACDLTLPCLFVSRWCFPFQTLSPVPRATPFHFVRGAARTINGRTTLAQTRPATAVNGAKETSGATVARATTSL